MSARHTGVHSGRRRPAAIAVALATLATLATLDDAAASEPTPEAAEAPTAAAVPPPNKRVYMITDSVGLGARQALPQAFPGDWLITLDGDAGEFTETLERGYVAPRLTTTPWVFGDYAIVAAGYNYPYWDPARFDRSIDSMIATLTRAGVKHIFWVTLRDVKPQYISPAAWRQVQPYYWYFPTVNGHLERALTRHANLSLIDWAAVADQPGLTYDAIHLNTTGAALYSAIARQAIVDATTAAPNGSVTRIPIPDAGNVAAVALNLTTVDPRSPGFLTAYDCDQPRPTVSNHNAVRDEVVAHAAIVPVGPSGAVCVYNHLATNLVVDITGRFSRAGGIADTTSTRLVDTRDRGAPQVPLTPLVVNVAAPAASQGAVALSVTAVGAAGAGWVRAAPCDATETTSTVNMTTSSPIPNVAVVRPAPDGTVCITASTTTHVIVDRFITFDPAAAISIPTPERVLDTRTDGGPRLAAGGVAVLSDVGLTPGNPASTASGVLLNVTVADPAAPGFLTVYPCAAGRPGTSNVNYGAGTVIANFVIVEPDANGDVCVFAFAPTHVVVDLLGTTGAGFQGGTPARLLDTRVTSLPPAWP